MKKIIDIDIKDCSMSSFETINIDFNTLVNLKNNKLGYNEHILKKHISRKCSGYKQQDKKHLRREIIINKNPMSVSNLILMLNDSDGLCYYCKKPFHVIPIHKNDSEQWSLDRIDNTQIHSIDNCVISCLKCNLVRRRRDHDKWKYTKQLVITKEY
jgi:hypothetical protein